MRQHRYFHFRRWYLTVAPTPFIHPYQAIFWYIVSANMGTFRGAIVPMNLHASADGRIWCFDSTLENVLQSRAITQFSDAAKHMELLGQTWRFYSSDAFGHKLGYRATKTGNTSKFRQPSLFIFNRDTSQLTMIPNAMDGAISSDGKRIAYAHTILFHSNRSPSKLQTRTVSNWNIWQVNIQGTF
ncbi:MAG: hypothetical protein Q9M24_04010 [Mariprofundaceae bacterium]|nr:hypothetical protein [Mariprofundaceae bacterium]